MIKQMIVVLMMLMLVSCSKVTSENFAKINTDMTYQEVVQILGNPSTEQSLNIMNFNAKNATWKYKQRTIAIQFIDDKVKMKTFVDEGQKTNKQPEL